MIALAFLLVVVVVVVVVIGPVDLVGRTNDVDGNC
jgi:Sec-independent protein translocase protein TatA